MLSTSIWLCAVVMICDEMMKTEKSQLVNENQSQEKKSLYHFNLII